MCRQSAPHPSAAVQPEQRLALAGLFPVHFNPVDFEHHPASSFSSVVSGLSRTVIVRPVDFASARSSMSGADRVLVLHRRFEDGVIGSRDGCRHPSRHRYGLEDGVAEAHRRPRAHRARRRRGRGAGAGRARRRRSSSWPESGVPDNPGAWLMAAAKHRAHRSLAPGEAASSASTRSSATTSRPGRRRRVADLDAVARR